MTKTPRRRPLPRLDPRVYDHNPVHVIIGTDRGSPLLARPAIASALLRLLENDELTLAACVMPDHLHWLLSRGEQLTVTVGRFKSVTTRLAWEVGVRRLWQRTFFDRVVRDRRQLRHVAEYIVHNPVRAELVLRAEDYRYSVLRIDRIDCDP